MFVRSHRRRKDGKDHTYWSLVETVRTAAGPRQRTVCYLGELNSSTEARWRKTVQVFSAHGADQQLALFPAGAAPDDPHVVEIRLDRVRWTRPRDCGDVWTGWQLWQRLGLATFCETALDGHPAEVPWSQIAAILAINRLCAPGSELAIEARWYGRTALDDILGVEGERVNPDRLYRCLDRLLPHKAALEHHLAQRYGELFGAQFEVLLYDLTSTYVEGDAARNAQMRRGYSRDHRSDCKQVVLALVVSPDGFPLAYEVFDGNRIDVTTLDDILQAVERKYGQAHRVWVLERALGRLAHQFADGHVADDALLHQRIGRLTERYGAVVRSYDITVTGSPGQRGLLWQERPEHRAWHATRAGAYLLRTNLTHADPAALWTQYVQLTEVEAAFRALKSELAIRPLWHQKAARVQAHILVAFLGYALWITLKHTLKRAGAPLSPRHALQRLRGIQSGDILLDTTDGRTLRLRRVSRPDGDQQHLLDLLRFSLPDRLGIDAECSADPAPHSSPNQSLGPAHSRSMRKLG